VVGPAAAVAIAGRATPEARERRADVAEHHKPGADRSITPTCRDTMKETGLPAHAHHSNDSGVVVVAGAGTEESADAVHRRDELSDRELDIVVGGLSHVLALLGELAEFDADRW